MYDIGCGILDVQILSFKPQVYETELGFSQGRTFEAADLLQQQQHISLYT